MRDTIIAVAFILVVCLIPFALVVSGMRDMRRLANAKQEAHNEYCALRAQHLATLTPEQQTEWLLLEAQGRASIDAIDQTRRVIGGLVIWNTLNNEGPML